MTESERARAAAAEDPIRSLDLSMFDEGDLVNVVLQRSNVLEGDVNAGPLVKAWTNGDEEPLRRVAADMGVEIVRRALGHIYLEYLDLKPLLEELRPSRVADIGCGYGFFDHFVHRDFGCDLVLIDLEENDRRHFQFRAEGAAYTSLTVAHRFLVANGCPVDRIETVNPSLVPVEDLTGIDLACSFISCGFHYPWDTYRAFFEKSMRPDGTIILDLRTNRAEPAMAEMQALGPVTTIASPVNGKARRVQVRLGRKRKARAA